MVHLFDHQHPWVIAFGILGNVVSIFVYLAPLPTFIRIFKQKSTLGYQSLPYVVALFSAMLWMYYALLKHAMLLISINSLGCLIETIYISIYIFYATKAAKKQTTKLLAILNVGSFCGVFIIAHFAFKNEIRIAVVGWICVAVSVCVFAAPLSIVFQVVRTRSTEFMPLALSLCLTVSAIMWFTYGLLQRDICVAVPNVLGFILGILQILLYGFYRKSTPIVVQEKEQKPDLGLVDIVILANPDQILPFDSQKNSPLDVTIKVSIDESEEKCRDNTVAGGGGGVEVELIPPPTFKVESPVLIVCGA